jgi:hypothetical protein
MRAAAVAFVGAVGFAACTSTEMLATWRAPGQGPVRFQTVAVIAPNKTPTFRRVVEEALCQRIQHARCAPSYRLIPDADLDDDALIHERLAAHGIEGVIVMRVLSVNREATWTPGGWYGPYYGYAAPMYDPGMTTVHTYVRVETRVYSLAEDRLLWASVSRTGDSESLTDLVRDTAKANADAMRSQGLLP